MYEIAKFWASRVTWLPERNGFGVLGAFGPDEYASNPNVNNSAFTNALAAFSLRLPATMYDIYIARTEWEKRLPRPDPRWRLIARRIYIPFDTTLQYHPEYDGYVPRNIT